MSTNNGGQRTTTGAPVSKFPNKNLNQANKPLNGQACKNTFVIVKAVCAVSTWY